MVRPRKKGPFLRTISFIGHLGARYEWSVRRKGTRVPAHDMVVSYSTGMEQKRASIKDISLTGIYLITEDRWLPGEPLLLTLHAGNQSRLDSTPQVRLAARVVRLGEDGVALSIVPDHFDIIEWLTIMSKAAILTSEDRSVRAFRMGKVLAFLRQASPAAEDQVVRAITKGLDPERSERALEIILRAQELLESRSTTPRTGVSPDLIVELLQAGSITQEEQMQQCWAGLLATSTQEGSDENANLSFATLLSKLEPVHLHILKAAGQKVTPMGEEAGTITSQPLPSAIDEWRKLTEAGDVADIEYALNRLNELCLLEPTIELGGLASSQHVSLTLTSVGLKLWAACNATVLSDAALSRADSAGPR